MKNSFATVVITAISAAIVLAGVYYAHWVCIRRRFVAIAPGRVYQSGAMAPKRLIRCVRRYGIDVVIDFRGAHEKPVQLEAQALTAAGIRHINIPSELLPSQQAIRRFNEVIVQELAGGRRVLLHCKDGEGRAVTFAAIYRMECEGWSPRQAYGAATRLPPAFRFVSLLFPGAGLLSRRNCKTGLILNYRRTLEDAQLRSNAAAQPLNAAADAARGTDQRRS